MKLFVSAVIGIVVGAFGTWLYSLKYLEFVSHMHTQADLQNTLIYIETLNENKHKELEASLIKSLPCLLHAYQETLDNRYEEQEEHSNKLISQAKEYTGNQSCPN